MICKQCGSILKDGTAVCDQCGADIGPAPRQEGSIDSRRQGRPDTPRAERGSGYTLGEREPLMPDGVISGRRRPRSEGAGRPSSRRGMPAPPTTGVSVQKSTGRGKPHTVRKMMVNWALVWTIVIALVLLSVAGGYVFLKATDAGQLILARMGRDANAQALWAYGEELLDQGYIERSIQKFQQAYEMEPQREDMYDRLQLLADAYEAGGYTREAEKIYTIMYSEVDETNLQAYRAVIRLMQDQNRRMELAAFLQLAYEKTGDVSFMRQRTELLPTPPSTDTEAGSRMLEQDVTLISAEDYDMYYLLDDEQGILPEDGILYTTPIHLVEGAHTLRAVAVSNDLVSDEMNIKYTINLPVPSAPYPSLAPGTYEQRQRVRLKYLESDEEKASNDPLEKDVTFYYTIDGLTPSSNSPIYDPEVGILLPGGRVTLKAVTVNGYGKVSNVLERSYKIKNVPFKNFFGEDDHFSGFVIMETTREEFIRKFGNPDSEQEITETAVRGTCVELTYSWGMARFVMVTDGYMLYAVNSGDNSLTGPRKTRIGMKEKDVTDLYKDMGQASDQNGDRSLYWDQYGYVGKKFHLDDVNDRIDYTYLREDGGKVTLSYYLENGRVTRMGLQYVVN